jgi:hypothetical protein
MRWRNGNRDGIPECPTFAKCLIISWNEGVMVPKGGNRTTDTRMTMALCSRPLALDSHRSNYYFSTRIEIDSGTY